jgi:gliding motility-associated-like protein
MQKFMFFLFFILLTTLAQNAIGQPSNWVWAKASTTPPTNFDYGWAICTDVSGNVYTTGFFQGASITFGNFTLTNSAGVADVFIVKYDASGNILWARSAGGDQFDEGQAICADASGNIYVTGWYQSASITFGNITLTNANPGNLDFFIVKYDPSGNAVWAKSAEGGNACGISTDASGNIYATGYFNTPTITFGNITLTNSGGVNFTSGDVFIVKYNSAGNALWAHSAGGNSMDIGVSVSTNALGNAIITGYFQSDSINFGNIMLTNVNAGTGDFFIAQYDAAGNVVWAKSMGGNGDDGGSSVSADSSGNIYTTGYFNSPSISFGNFTLTNANAGTNDLFITKYDASGIVLWTKSAGNLNDDYGRSVSTDIFGNFYLSGSFAGPAINFGTTALTAPSDSLEPAFIAKYDSSGNVLCAAPLSSGGGWNAVSADRFGNAYLTAGFEVNPFILGHDTLILSASQNVFVAKYNCCIAPSITAAASLDRICEGNSTILNAMGATNYVWTPTTGLSCTTCANPIASPTTTSSYTVTGTTSGCADTATTTITVHPKPIVNAGSDITVISGNSATLTATGGIHYVWNNGDTNAVITITPLATSRFCVVVSDTNNCTDTSCVVVTVKCGDFLVPTAFSPNNDGYSDLFILQGWSLHCIEHFSFAIFDRWGEKVFESGDPTNPWDGTFNGKLLNPAVFVYDMNISLITGETIKRKGNITLIR